MTIPLPPVLPRAVKLPTRASGLKVPCGGLRYRRGLAPLTVADLTTRGPYSALLRVGLAIPFLLPRPWWALTPPFHHHRGRVPLAPNTTAVFSLWRFPWGYPRRALPGTLPSWSPDFPRNLRPAVIQPSARGAAYAGVGVASTGKRAARLAMIAPSIPLGPPPLT